MTAFRTHYDNLKVARDAPDIVIRAAYKSLSQRYHPDKNPGDERAARVMALINQSYEVLSSPARRREHDLWIAREEAKLERLRGTATENKPQPPHSPPEQPNPPRRSGTQSPGRESKPLTLMLWPVRLLLKFFATAPRLTFLVLLIGVIAFSDAITPDSPPPPGPKPYQTEAPQPAAQLSDDSISDCRVVGSSDIPIYSYRIGNTLHYSSRKPPNCDGPAVAAHERPAYAPNRAKWPAKAGYVGGYPIDSAAGHSRVTVDNTQNDSDVFVKLVSLDGATAYPVRHFFIPAGSKFTINKLDSGRYDIRYRDLTSGELSRSEAFDVEERRTVDGIQYSEISMTLYKVQGGTFRSYALSEAEF